jgi:hypothetical protein
LELADQRHQRSRFHRLQLALLINEMSQQSSTHTDTQASAAHERASSLQPGDSREPAAARLPTARRDPRPREGVTGLGVSASGLAGWGLGALRRWATAVSR